MQSWKASLMSKFSVGGVVLSSFFPITLVASPIARFTDQSGVIIIRIRLRVISTWFNFILIDFNLKEKLKSGVIIIRICRRVIFTSSALHSPPGSPALYLMIDWGSMLCKVLLWCGSVNANFDRAGITCCSEQIYWLCADSSKILKSYSSFYLILLIHLEEKKVISFKKSKTFEGADTSWTDLEVPG